MNTNKKSMSIQRIAIIAMFCALSYASMLVIKIPVQFLDLDVKDSIIILCGLIFGPISAVAVSVIQWQILFLRCFYGTIAANPAGTC